MSDMDDIKAYVDEANFDEVEEDNFEEGGDEFNSGEEYFEEKFNIRKETKPAVKTTTTPIKTRPDMPRTTLKPVDVDAALSAFREYERVKSELLTPNDYMYFGLDGKPTSKDDPNATGYIKKEGWLKIKKAFRLSIAIGTPKRVEGEDSEGWYYMWLTPVRAVSEDGQFHEAIGACSSRKPFFSKKNGVRIDPREEDIILTSQTVGINRAISGLVGGGEISAEERGVVVNTIPSGNEYRPKPVVRNKDFGDVQKLVPQTYIIGSGKYRGKTFLQTPSTYIDWSIRQLRDGKFDPAQYGYNPKEFEEFLLICYKLRKEYEESRKKASEEEGTEMF